jgi:hypothetical protein
MKGLNGSRIMVLIFSGHANASEQVRREVERAGSQGMIILPFRVEDVRPEGAMEFTLSNRHWLDAFTPPVERKLELLARSVKTLLGNEVESAEGPRVTGDKPANAPTRGPAWVWRSVVAGVLMLGLLATWLGGVFKVKTPDGHARRNEDPEQKTEIVSPRADLPWLQPTVPDWKAPGYRLPTEAQWEYACGGDPADLNEHAWFAGNSGQVTHPVGKKLTNRFGLHDMLGNVWELCWDAYGENYYKQSPRDDPTGPDAAGAALRMIRGGNWRIYGHCRSAYRYWNTPGDRTSGLGFRLALVQ